MITKEKQMGCFGRLFQARPREVPDEQDASGRLSFDVYVRDDTCFQETENTSPPRQISPRVISSSNLPCSKAASLHPILFSGPCSVSSVPLGHNAKQYPRPSGCRLGRDSVKPSTLPHASYLGRDNKNTNFTAWSRDMTSRYQRNTLGDFLQPDSGAIAMKPHFPYLFTSESWRKRREQENHQQQEADIRQNPRSEEVENNNCSSH